MECKYQKLREDLCELGYCESFPLEAMPLVSKLFADLKVTTNSLQKYMKIAQQAIEERDILKLGAEPYRCNNAKLVKECNELHSQLIHCQEENEKIRKDLQLQLHYLKAENRSLNIENEKLKKKLKDFELNRILYPNHRKSCVIEQQKESDLELNSAMALCEKKINNLTKELKSLKQQQLQMMEANEMYQCQINNRNKEIERLKNLLIDGRPIEAINNEFGSKDTLLKFNKMEEEIQLLKTEKVTLDNRLKESLAKQHEAMKRALNLAKRNEQLEKELKDIDQMALTVEADCNTTVKNNAEKLKRLQNRIKETVVQLQDLEKENNKLKEEKLELKQSLDSCVEEKKQITEKYNNFTIIENDLNAEIDRLNKLLAEQRLKITELQSEIKQNLDESMEKRDKEKKVVKKSPEKQNVKVANKKCEKSKNATKKSVKRNSVLSVCCGECCNSKHLRELLDREMEYKQLQATRCIEAIKTEKEYYMKEYHKMLEDAKSGTTRPDNYYEVVQKLSEKENLIRQLQKEINGLSHEKLILMEKIESSEIQKESEFCIKCKRFERECVVLQNEIEKLEEERDCLKQKMKTLTENSSSEIEKLKQLLKEAEEKMQKLEYERRELTYDQGNRQCNLNKLENKCECLVEELRAAQSELNHQKIIYSQLKTLHEQADRNLNETKYQLVEAEARLENALQELKLREYSNGDVAKEVGLLKNDVKIMKTQLTQMDREKDELLNELDLKTENLVKMEYEMSSKNKTIQSLEEMVIDLKKKLGSTMDGKVAQDVFIRNSKEELINLQEELANVKKSKENAIQENRRLLDDLSAISNDCRNARNELELSKRQVDDLKRQLQHYVAEVKRTEDLISKKEVERGDLLDQFKSLSQEANILENSNHTLETEASQTKLQLSLALDHANDLEKQLTNKDTIIRSYEKEITDLTNQIASLELKLKQCKSQCERCEAELQHMRDLCLKLDSENDKLKQTVKNNNEHETYEEFVERHRQIERLETLLQEARAESNELKLLNEDLQEEMRRMKLKLEELQLGRVSLTNDPLSTSQEKAFDYSQPNIQLRSEMASERFYHSRDLEEKRYPSF